MRDTATAERRVLSKLQYHHQATRRKQATQILADPVGLPAGLIEG